MSKLSNKELLIWLKNAEHERLIYMPKYTLEQERQAYLQIKDLIQNQPEVDEAFMKKWSDILFGEKYVDFDIVEMLKEAGVKIKE